MLANILQSPSLIDSIRCEVLPAFSSTQVDLHHLTESCPLLKSVWLETLRLATASASVRYITRDTLINGNLLRKGNRLMIPYRQMHFDASVFGEDVNSFDPMRFMRNESLARSPSWRPFGGGQTLCPGRFAAQQTVLTFVAMILHRFDIELAYPQSFPRADEGRPVLGIMGWLDDLAVNIKLRKSE
jgi:cytochrome P450